MAGNPFARPASLFVRGYYWSTPIFLGLDVAFGIDLRIPFLDEIPGARAAYYLMGFVCGALVAFRPELTAIVGQVESSISAGVLIISTWLAYFSVVESAASADGMLANPFTPHAVTSLVFSASVFIASSLIRGAADPRASTA